MHVCACVYACGPCVFRNTKEETIWVWVRRASKRSLQLKIWNRSQRCGQSSPLGYLFFSNPVHNPGSFGGDLFHVNCKYDISANHEIGLWDSGKLLVSLHHQVIASVAEWLPLLPFQNFLSSLYSHHYPPHSPFPPLFHWVNSCCG